MTVAVRRPARRTVRHLIESPSRPPIHAAPGGGLPPPWLRSHHVIGDVPSRLRLRSAGRGILRRERLTRSRHAPYALARLLVPVPIVAPPGTLPRTRPHSPAALIPDARISRNLTSSRPSFSLFPTVSRPVPAIALVAHP